MHAHTFLGSVRRALSQWRIALLLARASLVETRRLNRLALLTPFLSVLLQVIFLGFVYREVFGVSLSVYLPYLALSLALWQSFASFLTAASHYHDTIHRHLSFTQLSPYTLHLAGLIETMMLLGAKLAAALIVILLAGGGEQAVTGLPFAVLGTLALAVLLFPLGVCAAYLLDRFRILKALLPQFLFLAFLLTPVLWQEEQLGQSRWVADWNPLTHGLEIVRGPLLHGAMPWTSLLVVLLIASLLALAGRFLHRHSRESVAFRWVA